MTAPWYAIPSASVERAQACLRAWQQQGYRTAVLVDGTGQPPTVEHADVVVWVPEYEGYFASVNRLARKLVALGAEIVVTGGDDVYPDPHVSGPEIAAWFGVEFPDLCGVMQPTGDDLPGTDRICGSPWLGRGWITRAYAGIGPFWPGYRQFYGDEELRIVATRLDRMVDRPDLCQRHDHWTRGREKTTYQLANDRHWSGDESLFIDRKRGGFPGGHLS